MYTNSTISSFQFLLPTVFLALGAFTPALCEPTSGATQSRVVSRIIFTPPSEQFKSEVEAAVAALKRAQSRLRENEQAPNSSNHGIYFGLQMGGPAAYTATNLSPRRVFLDFNFDMPNEAQETRTLAGNKAVKMSYWSRDGNGLVWDVTVEVSRWSNELENVALFNRPPHPF
jgi:hypothetical protein